MHTVTIPSKFLRAKHSDTDSSYTFTSTDVKALAVISSTTEKSSLFSMYMATPPSFILVILICCLYAYPGALIICKYHFLVHLLVIQLRFISLRFGGERFLWTIFWFQSDGCLTLGKQLKLSEPVCSCLLTGLIIILTHSPCNGKIWWCAWSIDKQSAFKHNNA